MRKFLRLLMLIVMVSYGAVCFAGDSGEIKCGDHNGEFKSFTVGDITLELTGPSNFKDHGVKVFGKYPNGQYWMFEKGSTLKITSSKGNICHVFVSFNSKGNTGSNRVTVADGDGGYWSRLNKETSINYSDGCWYSDTGGQKTVILTNNDDRADILWLRVHYYSGDQTTLTTKSSVTFDEDSKDVSIDSNVKWTKNGNTPGGDGTSTGGTAHIDQSCYLQTANVESTTISADCMHNGKTVDAFYGFTTQHYIKRYKLDITPSGYSTLCHYNNLNVPSGCTAYVYTKGTGSAGGFKTKLALICDKTNIYSSTGSNKVIPAWQAVIVKANTTPTTTTSYYFTNPDYDSNSGANTFTNVLTGNPNSTQQTTGFDTSKKYYYLMYSPYGDNKLGFYYGESGGAAIGTVSGSTKSNIHKAWLVLGSGEAAKGFTFYLPDDDSAPTAIGGIRADNTVDSNALMYNAAGQRVGSNYKGIVIQNGRKFLKR